MSWIVECQGQTIWEPALVVGRLFLAELVALERLFRCPSGIAETMSDFMEVDPVQLELFIRRGFEALGRTNSGPLLALAEGCFAIAIALNAKITGSWPSAPAELGYLVERAKTVLYPVPRTRIPPNAGPWSVVVPKSDLPDGT